MTEAKKKSFKAEIIADRPGGAWPRMMIPFNVEKEWGTRARVSVKGTVNGFEFRTSIFPNGDGTHHMMVNKAMRDEAKAKPGDEVRVTLEPDTAPRVVEVPAGFQKALNKHQEAKAIFEKFPPSHKKAYLEYIEEAKRPETRAARIEKSIARIAEGKKQM